MADLKFGAVTHTAHGAVMLPMARNRSECREFQRVPDSLRAARTLPEIATSLGEPCVMRSNPAAHRSGSEVLALRGRIGFTPQSEGQHVFALWQSS